MTEKINSEGVFDINHGNMQLIFGVVLRKSKVRINLHAN